LAASLHGCIEESEVTIEAVTTCVNYADYLVHTLPLLNRSVDSVLVITSPEDHQTQEVAKSFSADLLITDAFYRRGAKFNKGAAINEGLRRLKRDDWILHVDADIAVLEKLPSPEEWDATCIYYAAKENVAGLNQWQSVLNGGWSGNRRMMRRPVGYFQLWNAGEVDAFYPENVCHAGDSDKIFVDKNWPREQRKLIRFYPVYHLQMKNDENQDNWWGRKTERFQ
jgi:hypothetical protein